MASTELITSIAKPKRKRNSSFGNTLLDPLRLIADNTLAVVGAQDVIKDEDYATNLGAGVSNFLAPVNKLAGQAGAMILGGSAGASTMNTIQDSLGNLSGKKVGTETFAEGGLLTQYNGLPHTQGGIPLGQNAEVEDKETSFSIGDSDYIFSDQILVPGKKYSFASRSKKIASKYKDRPNDKYAKDSQQMEFSKLARSQENVKQTAVLNGPTGRGQRTLLAKGGTNPPLFDYSSLLANYDDPIPTILDKEIPMVATPSTTITPMKSLGTPTSKLPLMEKRDGAEGVVDEGYKSNFLPTALGYTGQMASNIYALTQKPDRANFSRVKFKPTSLAEARNEARRTRNLSLATAKGVGANDAGQIINYLSGTMANLNSQYGNQFNQSLLQEKAINSELNTKEQLANSEIERYEEQINTAEKDAIRNLKMEALSNIGTVTAMAGKDYLLSQQADAQINQLGKIYGDYGLDKNLNIFRKRYRLGGKKGGKV